MTGTGKKFYFKCSIGMFLKTVIYENFYKAMLFTSSLFYIISRILGDCKVPATCFNKE